MTTRVIELVPGAVGTARADWAVAHGAGDASFELVVGALDATLTEWLTYHLVPDVIDYTAQVSNTVNFNTQEAAAIVFG
jgi:hypothetical protein